MMLPLRAFFSCVASLAVMAIGFSQSTCLPAFAAARVSGTCRWVGQRIEDGLDLGVRQHLLIGTIGLGCRAPWPTCVPT